MLTGRATLPGSSRRDTCTVSLRNRGLQGLRLVGWVPVSTAQGRNKRITTNLFQVAGLEGPVQELTVVLCNGGRGDPHHIPKGWGAPGTPGWPSLGSALGEDYLQPVPGTEAEVTWPPSRMPVAVLAASFLWGQDSRLARNRKAVVNAGAGEAGPPSSCLGRLRAWVPAASQSSFP